MGICKPPRSIFFVTAFVSLQKHQKKSMPFNHLLLMIREVNETCRGEMSL